MRGVTSGEMKSLSADGFAVLQLERLVGRLEIDEFQIRIERKPEQHDIGHARRRRLRGHRRPCAAPRDQPTSVGFGSVGCCAAIQASTLMMSAALRLGVSQPVSSRGVSP